MLLVAVAVGTGAYFLNTRKGTSAPELEPPLAPPAPSVEAPVDERVDVPVIEEVPTEPTVEPEPVRPKPTLRERLAKARASFAGFLGRSKIDEETWDALEEALIRADLGVGPAMELVEHLRARVADEGLETGDQLVDVLKTEMKRRLQVTDRSLRLDEGQTNVWL
ncbi:MAG: signal recognition particle receptor subunit alpha, partial [Aquihabitans sp.]